MGAKKLGQGAITTGAGTLVYTVPTGMRTEVRDICVTNTTAGALTLSLHLVPAGGSAGTTNAMYQTFSIASYVTEHWSGNQVLNAGDFIQGIGSGSGLTVNISGDESRA